jgi:hypothetical protein
MRSSAGAIAKWSKPGEHERMSEVMKKKYQDPAERERVSVTSKLLWKDPVYRAKVLFNPPGQSGFNELYKRYKAGAKFKGLGFEFTQDEFRGFTEGPCHYCGKPPSGCCRRKNRTYGEYAYSGLDRVDNNLGYIHGNVVSCCSHCNKAKRMMSVDEFRSWVDRVYHHFVKPDEETTCFISNLLRKQ